MRKNRLKISDPRSYDVPQIVQVGMVAGFTAGYGVTVTDPPHDGASGWYDPDKDVRGAEVDLDAA